MLLLMAVRGDVKCTLKGVYTYERAGGREGGGEGAVKVLRVWYVGRMNARSQPIEMVANLTKMQDTVVEVFTNLMVLIKAEGAMQSSAKLRPECPRKLPTCPCGWMRAIAAAHGPAARPSWPGPGPGARGRAKIQYSARPSGKLQRTKLCWPAKWQAEPAAGWPCRPCKEDACDEDPACLPIGRLASKQGVLRKGSPCTQKYRTARS